MINCPNCAKPLGEVPPSGVLVAMCANCRFKFEAIRGVVTGFQSEQITVATATPQRQASYARAYHIRLELPGGHTEEFGHESAGENDWLYLQRGDRACVIYSLRNDQREELVTIVNYTSQNQFQIARPGSKSTKWAMMGAAFVAVVGALVFAQLGLEGAPDIAAGVGAGFISFFGFRRWLRPVHAIAADEREEIAAGQSLLEHKYRLETASERVRGERAERSSLRARLMTLQEKMRSVNLPAYAPRIEAIASAIHTLDEQIILDDRLLTEYARTIKIVEIEHETAVAGIAMSDDVSNVLRQQRDELREIEDHQADLARRLSANAEVEQLLRSPR
jgi:hypothetical protein